MAVIHAPETEFAKEKVKWEAQHTAEGPGLRPYTKLDWPAVMYKAARLDGSLMITETDTATSDQHAARLRTAGFFDTPNAAHAAVEAQESEFAKLSAERNFHERRMSPQAQAEAAQFDAEHFGHQPTVPVHPLKRRGRPKKQITAGESA